MTALWININRSPPSIFSTCILLSLFVFVEQWSEFEIKCFIKSSLRGRGHLFFHLNSNCASPQVLLQPNVSTNLAIYFGRRKGKASVWSRGAVGRCRVAAVSQQAGEHCSVLSPFRTGLSLHWLWKERAGVFSVFKEKVIFKIHENFIIVKNVYLSSTWKPEWQKEGD